METLLLRIGLGNALAAAALAVVAAVATRWSRRPALVHGLWLLVMLKLVTPPLATFDVEWPSRPDVATETVLPKASGPILPRPIEVAPTPVEEPIPEIADRIEPRRPMMSTTIEPIRPAPSMIGAVDRHRAIPIPPLSTIVTAFWLAGAIGWIGFASARLIRFHRRLGAAEDAPPDVKARSDSLALRIGLRRPPSVAMLPGAISPLLWAVWSRPRLLIPLELWSRLDGDQRDALLIHELAHLRRGDHWVRLLELVVGGLYWWFPVAWWARRALREAEEECCDAWVVWALPESNRSYASALLEAVEFLSEPRAAFPLPLGASGMGQFRHLSRRIAMIMKGSTPRRLSWVGLVGMIALAALLLPWLPSLSARQEPKPEPTPIVGPVVVESSAEAIVSGSGAIEEPTVLEPVGVSAGVDPARVDPAKLEEARDEVELLEATEKAKKAAVDAAAVEVGIQEGKVKRLQELLTKGAVDIATLHESRAAHQNAVSQLAIRQAELNEAAVRLRQAKRRLERLEQAQIAPRLMGPGGLPLPGASGGAMPMMPGRPVAPMPTAKPGDPEAIPTMPGAGPGMMPGGMAGMMAPKPATKAQRIRESQAGELLDIERLKRIGLALHNYADVNGHLPPASITGEDGKPLLSWRVAILPFLEDPTAKGLYEQFHLDEPWDSQHNRGLMLKIPDTFADSHHPALFPSEGWTGYLAIVGPGAAFEEAKGLPFTAFTDGTSNTLVAVRASTGVLWTKPNDLTFPGLPGRDIDPVSGSKQGAFKGIIDPTGNGILSLFADGSVRRLSPDIPNHTFRALLTRNGGEVIAADDLGPIAQDERPSPGVSLRKRTRGGTATPTPGAAMPAAPTPAAKAARPVVPMPTATPGNPEAIPAMTGGMSGMMDIAVPAGPTTSDSKHDIERLLRIGCTLRDYAYANNHFPPAAIMSKDGKPLLSWRVAILPFMDDPSAKGLYEQFHLDEPWDSPHNKTLIAKIPNTFANAYQPTAPSAGYTSALAFVGPDAGFGAKEGNGVASFTDGTSNTLLVARAGSGVVWTAPNDLTFDTIQRKPGDPANGPDVAALKRQMPSFGDGLLVLFADGAVRRIPSRIADHSFRALITRNGGEVISSDDLGPENYHRESPREQAIRLMTPPPGTAPPAAKNYVAKAARSPHGPQPSDSDRRIAELETKMDRLLQEIEAIRKERSPASPEPTPAPPAPSPKP